VAEILADILPRTGMLVLDVGCGTANNTLLFAKAIGLKVVGIDFSLEMLREGHKTSADIPFIQAPAKQIPFIEEVFDLIFMTDVIHHLSDTHLALSELHRVIKRQGSLCIATQSHQQIEDRMTSRFFPATIAIDKARYPNIDEIINLLSESDFVDIKSRTKQFKPIRLGQEYLRIVENRGYSMLHKISDSEYREGLEALRNAFVQGEDLTYSAGYTFVWAKKK
jgi:ubiquinone/menaquinone biosynthesis C-methylase UbiE